MPEERSGPADHFSCSFILFLLSFTRIYNKGVLVEGVEKFLLRSPLLGGKMKARIAEKFSLQTLMLHPCRLCLRC